MTRARFDNELAKVIQDYFVLSWMIVIYAKKIASKHLAFKVWSIFYDFLTFLKLVKLF